MDDIDEWEDTVAVYSLSLGVEFGFQIFALPRKGAGVKWYPSTVYLATHTLTAALRDVASRSGPRAAISDTPATLLNYAAHELHHTIFQPYNTWLKAANLQPPSWPSDLDSLHVELADLALYWLVYSEAANLRHTSEMIWFIFFCAQRSWQFEQVLDHIKRKRDELKGLSKQPWLEALGPGLLCAVQALHDKYRRTSIGDDGGGAVTGEAAAVQADGGSAAAAASATGGGSDGCAAAGGGGCGAGRRSLQGNKEVHISVFANGTAPSRNREIGPDDGAASPGSSRGHAAVRDLLCQQLPLSYSSVAADAEAGTPKTRRQPCGPWAAASYNYRELLLQFCPRETAVASALLAAADGAGDGDVPRFLDEVVQPLFLFLTEQVYELGQARQQGLEAAVRIGYDDVSESMAHPSIVAAALKALPDTSAAQAAAPAATPMARMNALQRTTTDESLYWSRLLALSKLPPTGSARIPWQGDMACHCGELLAVLGSGYLPPQANGPSGGGGGDNGGAPPGAARGNAEASKVMRARASEADRLRRANAAADWWSRHVLRKTFAEHRSIAMPLIAFSRVFQFHLLWFYLLAAWNWSGDGESRAKWVAAVVVLHWGFRCLIWSMQEFLSTGPRMEQGGQVVPVYDTRSDQQKVGGAPIAPYRLYSRTHHAVQIFLLAAAWVMLFVGIYVPFIVWPAAGRKCYPLLGGNACYTWLALAYSIVLVLYELLYRQCNCGGFARGSGMNGLLFRLMPNQGTASASSARNPLYNPATNLRTGPSYLLGNAALWFVTLGLKFLIDYFIIVRPAGLQLPEVWATNRLPKLGPCMAAAQVIVLFLMSLVSSGVAYTVVTALWGVAQGLRQGVGSIRNWAHIRSGFHRVQAAMRAKLLRASAQRLQVGDDGGVDSRIAEYRTRSGRVTESFKRQVVTLRTAVESVLCCGWLLPQAVVKGRPKNWVKREATLGMTAPFWNAIVRSMRGRDLLSDREAEALSFTAVCLSPASMLATWRRERDSDPLVSSQSRLADRQTYLPPVAVYAGQLYQLVITGSQPSYEQLEQLQEAYVYLLHLLVAVGAIPRSAGVNQAGSPGQQAPDDDAAAAESAGAACPNLSMDMFHPDAFAEMPPRSWSHQGLVGRRQLLGSVVELVRALVATGKVYKDTASLCQQAGGGGREANSGRERAIDKICMALHGVARCMAQVQDLPNKLDRIMDKVAAKQHFHSSQVKQLLDQGFSALVMKVNNSSNAATAAACWANAAGVLSYDDFAKVSSWLLAALRPTDEGTAPSNPEAVSLLADFCSGLLNPWLPAAPRVEAMRSVSTLIPHYHETVMYALNSADAGRVVQEQAGSTSLGLEGKLADDEVLFKNDDGAPSELLQYLLSEFPDEFRNLMERCRTLVPLDKNDAPYILEDFLPQGRLYTHRAQLLLWASCRGQVLARTVDGMHMYHTALALQAVHDALVEAGAGSSQQGPPGAQRQLQPLGRPQRLTLNSVQRLQVHGIMREGGGLAVEELVARLMDVVPELGPLLERKYGLVVASQVFSKMAASRSLADRWRAHGIALLATRYSAVRVAYLEQDGDPITLYETHDFSYKVVHQASLLQRAVPLEVRHNKARAEKRAAAAAAAAATVPVVTVAMDGACAATSSATSPSHCWADARSTFGASPSLQPAAARGGGSKDAAAAAAAVCGGADSGGGGGDDGGSEDAAAALRVWRRRFHLENLRAAELEVLYRLRLPLNYYDTKVAGVGVILGEGKPENQNSAVPYCPGVLLQTIDMNQDNSLAQAFKLRNTTSEFEPLGQGREQQHVALVGYPEWIFSYRCGLLADLAAATERTFGTQIQRVMAFPSAVRAHYGHPDLWNRLFSMTRGGVSKANAVQHVSEDVFGGYNALKRGGLSKYVSYISVGKGRDMGLDSILGFEGKISKGCAEQLMSRDLRFLGAHTDFFRSMSLYFTVPGHFINTWLTVVTIQLGVWVQLLLLLGGVGMTGSRVSSAAGAIQILQLGTMPLLGHLFNLWLENGMALALVTIARQFVGGGLLFHIFRSVTSAFHLGRAVLFGGASYVATGRGFSLRRRTFTQVYVNYGRSHLYLGVDILMMVALILVVGNNGGYTMPVPAAAMWSPLLVAFALLAGPFWFTPFFFRLSQVLADTREFRNWVSSGSAARGVAESWHEWHDAQLQALRDDAGRQVPSYRFWSALVLVAPRAAVCVLSAVAAVTAARFETPFLPDLAWVLGGSASAWLLVACLTATRRAYLNSGLASGWRWAKSLSQVVVLGAAATLGVVCLFLDKKGLRFASVLITLYANYSAASLIVCVLVAWMPRSIPARWMVGVAYRQVDSAFGTVLCAALIVVCFISEIGIVMLDKVQTLVQFNDRYSHTQAAKPYNGEDDVAAAAGCGGAGMLRQRLSCQPAPPRPAGGVSISVNPLYGGRDDARTPPSAFSGRVAASTAVDASPPPPPPAPAPASNNYFAASTAVTLATASRPALVRSRSTSVTSPRPGADGGAAGGSTSTTGQQLL